MDLELDLDREQQLSIMKPSGLPEELILECFARLPNESKSRFTASLVCTDWLAHLQSRQFYLLRKQYGHINHLACLLHSHHPPPSRMSWSWWEIGQISSSNPPPPPTPSHVINVFNPVSREFKTLPPLPNPAVQFDQHSEIVSSEGKLILMNKCDPVNLRLGNSLFVFEFTTGRWRQGKSLPTRKLHFAMAASDDCQVFVAGGYHPEDTDTDSAWKYDVRKDEWSELPRAIHFQGLSSGEVSGNKFVVRTQSMFALRQYIEIYDIKLGEWKHFKVKQSWTKRYQYFALIEDGEMSICSSHDMRCRIQFYLLPLGDRALFISYKKGNGQLDSISLKEEGKDVKIEVPHQIYGDVYSMCSVEVH